jgi:hypothetical protein
MVSRRQNLGDVDALRSGGSAAGQPGFEIVDVDTGDTLCRGTGADDSFLLSFLFTVPTDVHLRYQTHCVDQSGAFTVPATGVVSFGYAGALWVPRRRAVNRFVLGSSGQLDGAPERG